MKIVKYPDKKDWNSLLERPAIEGKAVRGIVKPIIKKVRQKGDKALRKFAYEYDHVELDELFVNSTEIKAAEKVVDNTLKKSIEIAFTNIEKFHKAQRLDDIEVETFPGVRCSRKTVPIQRVGLYIPGGSAPLFSTILMLGIPAILAGCEEIIMCTPSNRNSEINPVILYTAKFIGIQKIFKVGGAQAIAAMAYGTETIPKVDKIFGPGNQYVTTAKQLVSQKGAAIDMPAGPSELAVIADDSAIPEFVASDLLSQAEHGIDSQVIMISNSDKMIQKVISEIKNQTESLSRKHIVIKSLEHSRFILVKDLNEAMELSNNYAPEHLIIASEKDTKLAEKVINAGSVFLGNYTPESAGDYASGTNHTLPTYGYAKAYSGVSLDSFMKHITFQKISKKGLLKLGPSIELMADAEKLEAHKKAVGIRLNKIKEDG
jgi:histidinol dehydrogenase